ncbi:DUF659 domain-containing protein [Mycena indigotica]|uniref:DUF659 domain-containing protein n=1 Tax=Mycena indigotica TaxID=2126181 RepID=A0A8H6VQD8_9AGAR|nr:DUF659 domain-containing protein [Mycena indigotica]KAF7290222.1 DUF659 domain-containing protein [Mycena indigotica]
MSTLLLDAEHSDVHLKLVEELLGWQRSGMLIIDGWEDQLRRELYGVAAGRVGDATIVMGLYDVTGHRGNAETVLKTAKTAMADMGITNASPFLAAVTDNPNVMKCFRKMLEKEFPWLITLACWAHGLNTLIGEICRYADAKREIKRANRVVTFFNGSHYWGGQLKTTAAAEGVNRGLKKNCESRWYALILLLRSILSHRTPLITLVAREDACHAAKGLSAVNEDVIRTVRDPDDTFWPMVSQTVRIAQPFVDAIALCEGRAATLGECMLNLVEAARQLSLLKDERKDDIGFKEHAYQVVDKRFRNPSSPSRSFPPSVVSQTSRALDIAKNKWKWPKSMCKLLLLDLVEYHGCREPWNGGDRDLREWWKRLSVSAEKHPLKPFAMAINSICPHSAEIERLFSACNGIQSAKRNSLGVDTFSKLAKIRSKLVEEAKSHIPAKKTKVVQQKSQVMPLSTRMTAANSPPLGPDSAQPSKTFDEDLWDAPLEGDEDDGEEATERAFAQLEETLDAEKEDEDSEQAAEDTPPENADSDEELPERLKVGGKKKKKSPS